MFCPNCGNNCGDAKFCSNCGQNLRTDAAEQTFEARKKQLQAEGQIYCPECLSTNYTTNKEKRRSIYYLSPLVSILEFVNFCMSLRIKRMCGIECVCLQCGNSWFPKIAALHGRYKKHVLELLEGYAAIEYPALNGASLCLEENRLIIYQPQKRAYIIPFERIMAVDYRESIGLLYGRISIRDTKHKKRSFPDTVSLAEKDRLTVFYDPRYKLSYYQLYSALQMIAEENKKAGII